MGAILNRQGDTDYSGLQLFAAVTCLVGTGLLAASTYYMGQSHGTWKV
jgi:hypothetical protein